MKQLFLLRHAKSDWSDPFLSDHDRPLNKRGRTAAANIGSYFKQKSLCPELVLCSTAQRTQETLNRLQKHAGANFNVSYESSLYGADAGQTLSLIQQQPDNLSSLMIIGHNPAIEDLAIALIGHDDSNQLHLIHEKVPTGALIQLGFEVDQFAHVSLKSGHLQAFIRPKHELKDALSSKLTQS